MTKKNRKSMSFTMEECVEVERALHRLVAVNIGTKAPSTDLVSAYRKFLNMCRAVELTELPAPAEDASALGHE